MGFWDAVTSAGPYANSQFFSCSRQITTPTPHHSISTGRMLFLMPNQQCKSTEGITPLQKYNSQYYTCVLFWFFTSPFWTCHKNMHNVCNTSTNKATKMVSIPTMLPLRNAMLETHTPTRLTALCPRLPGWAGTRKVKPIWILLKQQTVSGSGISLHLAPVPHHSVFYRPPLDMTVIIIKQTYFVASSAVSGSLGSENGTYDWLPRPSSPLASPCTIIHTHMHTHTHAHTHTHTRTFNGPLSRTTWVSRYQKGKTNLDFTEAWDSEWQWHQLGHM